MDTLIEVLKGIGLVILVLVIWAVLEYAIVYILPIAFIAYGIGCMINHLKEK